MKFHLLLAIFVLVIGSFSMAYAQTTYTINIPTGAGDPDAPYFWQSEKDGRTDGVIHIVLGDTVNWENADTVTHTVTSGTVDAGPDGIFDTGLFPPGQSFRYTFEELGNYPYYCVVHPWMVGEVIVTEGMSVLPDVGKQVGDGTSFDVEYQFSRLLANPLIDVDQKSITFELVGNAKSSDHTLFVKLDSDLLDGPYVVWVDGEKLTDFEHDKEGEMNLLSLPLTENAKLLTIVGTSVVPEFGVLSVVVLAVAIISVVALSQKSRLHIGL